MTDLVQWLHANANAIVARVNARVYADPFWLGRYGERGRRYIEEDGHHHLSYIGLAILSRDTKVFRRYTRWLQKLLTTRGMCSRHVAENYRWIGEVLTEFGPRHPEIDAILAAGVETLGYPDDPAAWLQRNAEVIVQRHLAGHHDRPALFGRQRYLDDALDLVSYLADALALGRPELFVKHCQWAAEFSRDPDALAALLRGLGHGIVELASEASIAASSTSVLELAIASIRPAQPKRA